jgi:formate/nitrite transporter FocA (FNT family)
MALVFPFGLLMVVLTGGELITSSFSTVGAAFLAGVFKVGLQAHAQANLDAEAMCSA